MRYSIEGENGFGDGGIEAYPDWPQPAHLHADPDTGIEHHETEVELVYPYDTMPRIEISPDS